MGTSRISALAALAVCGASVLGLFAGAAPAEDLKKHYWATSLSRSVDDAVLQGLYEAVARGEIGWLDVDDKNPLPPLKAGVNLIFYHVGGNCYIRHGDCDRFPASKPTGDRWGSTERSVDLADPAVRKIVVD